MAEADIKFPYYGQTLYDLVSGGGAADAEQRFQQAVLEEVQQALHPARHR